MILLDDNFSSIVVAIEEGRRIFDNMKKTISYVMVGNFLTLLPFIIYVIFGFPLANGTITGTLVCLGTDMMPAISLTREKSEGNIMKIPPRNPRTDNLVTSNLLLRSYAQIGIIITAAGYIAHFREFWSYGWAPWHLWQIGIKWDDHSVGNLTDTYGNAIWVEMRSYSNIRRIFI